LQAGNEEEKVKAKGGERRGKGEGVASCGAALRGRAVF